MTRRWQVYRLRGRGLSIPEVASWESCEVADACTKGLWNGDISLITLKDYIVEVFMAFCWMSFRIAHMRTWLLIKKRSAVQHVIWYQSKVQPCRRRREWNPKWGYVKGQNEKSIINKTLSELTHLILGGRMWESRISACIMKAKILRYLFLIGVAIINILVSK